MADNRGRDGGYRGAGRGMDRKPRADKPGYGDKKGFAPRGEKPAFGEKKDFRPRGEKPAFGEKKDFRPRADRPDFGGKKGYAPRGDRPANGEKRSFRPRGDRPAPRKPESSLVPRRVALETLLDVSRSDAYASLALDKRLAAARLYHRDRAFVTQLVYGTLENRLTLDWRIDQFLESEDKALDP
ncbi:MAG: hypothetical protein MR821_00410, partial [Clostridiales bacterium]|nr:hypothetical protein [Clostridiales bacterium]